MSIIKLLKVLLLEVSAKAKGEKILKSLTPGDQVIKIVHDELKKIDG